MTQKDHVHKLKKVRFKSGNTTFFCALPSCSFKINPALALGKITECWRCGKPFQLSEYTLRLVKPHCDECHQPKNAPKAKILTEDSSGHIVVKEEINPTAPQTATPSSVSLAERLKQTVSKTEEEMDI
jgi:hypothetical protein